VDDLGERVTKRLASGWTENKVRALTNEAILERLAGFGIVTSVAEFVELARPEHAADAVAAGWRRSFDVSARGFDNDFIGIAACVLWERLLPEWPSFEMLDERMQAGYAALKANDVTRACDLCWRCGKVLSCISGRPSGVSATSTLSFMAPSSSSTGARSSNKSWATPAPWTRATGVPACAA
jgi:hypothetical protein